MFGGASITSVLLVGLLFISSVICDRKFREKKQALTECQNGGEVSECTCSDDFAGQFCQTDVFTCQNGGTLVSGAEPSCTCPSSNYGPHCEYSCKSGAKLLKDGNDNPLGCYIISTTLQNWYDSGTTCSNNDATLAVIDSAAEDKAIKLYLKTLKYPAGCDNQLFTAGQRGKDGDCTFSVPNQNNFYWKPIGGAQTAIGPNSYTGWCTGEPNCSQGFNNTYESCITEYGDGGGWNDYGCYGTICAICEQALISY